MRCPVLENCLIDNDADIARRCVGLDQFEGGADDGLAALARRFDGGACRRDGQRIQSERRKIWTLVRFDVSNCQDVVTGVDCHALAVEYRVAELSVIAHPGLEGWNFVAAHPFAPTHRHQLARCQPVSGSQVHVGSAHVIGGHEQAVHGLQRLQWVA